jgi:hypothetical protein
MSKYGRLTGFLLNQAANEVTVTFEDMENREQIGLTLPDSAKTYRQWWDNESKPDARQCRAWMDAGWVVSDADLTAERITFRRRPATRRSPTTLASEDG